MLITKYKLKEEKKKLKEIYTVMAQKSHKSEKILQ